MRRASIKRSPRLRVRPWEYLLLRATPRPGGAEDSVLVAFSMYLNLNDSTGEEELARGQLRSALPAELFAFLHPFGTQWDAPVTGGAWRAPPIPGPDVMDLRSGEARLSALRAPRATAPLEEKLFAGSNSWAVAGTHSSDGAALLANDMHLGLRLPHVWYRARLIVDATGDEHRDLVGVTLPGLPVLVVGSNGHVAWGYTNSYGDWTDLVVVEADPANADQYLTPEGSEAFVLRQRDDRSSRRSACDPGSPRKTRWGPVVNNDEQGRPLALAWTAHHARATNVRMLDFEGADSLEALLDAANRAGVPAQNFLAADRGGRIGWTLMGQVPVRAELRLDDAGVVAQRRDRMDRLARRPLNIRASSIRPPVDCGPPTRGRSMRKRGLLSSATAASISAHALPRFATTCWRCPVRARATCLRFNSMIVRCS